MRMSTTHLTEDQLDDHLLGDLAPEAELHLAACAACQQRVRAAEAPLASFRDMSLAWAERRSATMPTGVELVKKQPSRRFAWAMAATSALAVGVAIPALHERTATTPAPPETMAVVGHTGMTSVTPVAASSEQIANDNQMLQQIDRALGTQDVTLASYAMEPQSAPARAAHRNVVRD